MFLERRGETLTVVKMRDYLREIDLDFNQKVRAARRGRQARAHRGAPCAGELHRVRAVEVPEDAAAALHAAAWRRRQRRPAARPRRGHQPAHCRQGGRTCAASTASHRSAQADRASDSNACARPRCNGCTRRHRDLARSPACRPPTSATSWPARSSPRCAISLSSCAALSLTRADVAAVEIRGAPSAEGQEGRAEGARRGAQDRPLRGGAEAPRRGGSSQGRGRAASQGRVALAPQGPRCPVAVSRHRVHVRHQASATSSGLCPTSQPRVAAHTGTDIRHEIFI